MTRLSRKTRTRLLRVVQIVALIALAALLWRAGDGWAALAKLRGADPAWLGAAILTLTLQTVLSAARWRITAGQIGIKLGPARRSANTTCPRW